MQKFPIARPRARAAAKPVRATEPATEAGAFRPYAYALPRSAARDLMAGVLPAGVELALVATDEAAEATLKAWAPAGTRRAGRIVTADPAGPTVGSGAYDLGARARALLRGRTIAEADLAEAGGAFDPEQARILLNGISRQALEKRVREGSLLAVPGPSNRRRYPAAQFTAEGVVPGLKEVRQALPTRNPWAVLNFLVRPDGRLDGRTPIEVLSRGEVDRVVAVAQGMGVQGG